MKASDIKKHFRTQYGLAVRVHTILTKAPRYIDAWLPFQGPIEFPIELRHRAIRIVYPNNPDLHIQVAAGNIRSHMISLLDYQWAALLGA